jgi:hypothetical protein
MSPETLPGVQTSTPPSPWRVFFASSALKPIFNSPVCEAAERQRQSARVGGLALHFRIWRKSGGRGVDGGRERDTGCAQGEAGGGTPGGANDKALAVVLDL